jgi:hypothetical protein
MSLALCGRMDWLKGGIYPECSYIYVIEQEEPEGRSPIVTEKSGVQIPLKKQGETEKQNEL